MNDGSATSPRIPDGLNRESFPRFAEPHRRELKLHCYRMLGSIQEAEDAVQETFVNAWRSLDEFEGRSLFKNWLYRIATNTCLNALTTRSRRPRLLPEQLGAPATGMPTGDPASEVSWLQPYPDVELEGIDDSAAGPERRYEMREAVRLAFMAAIQRLPARQRATLILSDVIGWSAAEIASLFGSSVASVNSVLQRARESMRAHYGNYVVENPMSDDTGRRHLLDRYVRAWESRDLEGFVSLLEDDARYSMPPRREWYVGRAAIGAFFGHIWKHYRGFRLVPVFANAQPAYALYTRGEEPGHWTAHSLQVLSVSGDRISALTMFMMPLWLELVPRFRLPLTLG